MKLKDLTILPHAGIVKEGDCGAYCIGTLAGITVKEVYRIYGEEIGLSYHAIITVIQKLGLQYENWLPTYHMIDHREDWFTFGYPAYQNWMKWFELSEGRTKRGLIGIAHVNLHGEANIDPYANHFVLITVENQGDNATEKIVNVLCPTHGYFEINAKNFLLRYGGYNTIWVNHLIKVY